MRQLLPILLALLVALTAAAKTGDVPLGMDAPQGTDAPLEMVGGMNLSNPWVTLTEAPAGLPLRLPEGAENALWRALPAMGLTEVQFTLDGLAYTARCMPCGAREDISGMYYRWTEERLLPLGAHEALMMTAPCDGGTAMVCLWYDAEAGMTAALSVIAGGALPDLPAVAAAMLVQTAADTPLP